MKEIPFTWKGAQMKCLIESCSSIGKTRGLCLVCYQAASISIKKGDTTWEELEKMGFANRPQHRGRGDGAFSKALREKKLLVSPSIEVAEKAVQQARDGEGCTITEFIKEVSDGG